MPPSEKVDSVEGQSDRDRERGSEKDRDKNGSKAKGGQAKVKDLSHVPCKFFKLGQCTAGSSCPFSHHVSEPGQQKDVCQWFVKGNCKFGHKCALAHILAGQPMSMDRKNKKAAQQAAAAAAAGGNGGGSGSPRGDRRKPPLSSAAREDSLRVGLGRGMGRGTAPISISKATISPSAPAPPLRDTDFPFGLSDDFTKPVQSQSKQTDATNQIDANDAATVPSNIGADAEASSVNNHSVQGITVSPPQPDSQRPSPLPLSKPSGTRGFSRQNGSGDFGFGPIGSPPRSSPGHTPTSQAMNQGQLINGFSPSTSPSGAIIGAPVPSTSPFSAPVAKSIFMSYSLDRDSSASTHLKASTTSTIMGGGVAASLGAGRGWDIGYTGGSLGGAVDEDDDLEEFLPSSLNELLTEEEKKRRWSRTGGQRPSIEQQHHRYSRSVPAASLMDNVKNIWGENGKETQRSGAPSPSLLGTSNISTGFMPRRPSIGAARAFSDTPTTAHPNNVNIGFNGSGSSPGGGFASPPHSNFYMLNRPSHPVSSTTSNFNAQQPRPIPGVSGEEQFSGNPLSPSARALQEHAPGQSLPQGLAAGLSRIHVKPPTTLGTSTSPYHLPGLPSGSSTPGVGTTMARGYSTSGDFSNAGFGVPNQGSPSTLSRDPFDRLPSFSSRGIGSAGPGSGGPSPSPGTMGVGFRRQQQWGSHPLSSPLSGPVITSDEDDGLFAMDEDSK